MIMGAVRYGVASLTACDEWALATQMVANAAPSMKTNASMPPERKNAAGSGGNRRRLTADAHMVPSKLRESSLILSSYAFTLSAVVFAVMALWFLSWKRA